MAEMMKMRGSEQHPQDREMNLKIAPHLALYSASISCPSYSALFSSASISLSIFTSSSSSLT